MSKSLRLIEHKLNQVTSTSFDLHPKKIKAWIEALPKGNLGATSRLIYQTLAQTNRLRYPYQDRTRYLEILQEQLIYISTGMAKHFIAVSYPLPPKSKKIALLSQQLNTEISYGYILALEEMLARYHPFSNKKLLTLLLHRSMTCLSRELLNSYQLYFPYRKNIWRDIHTIFSVAKNKKLHDVFIVDNFNQQAINMSISEQYKRILLLSLASPFCLRHHEITKIYNSLEHLSHLIKLTDYSASEYCKAVFCFDSSSNKPPRSLIINTSQINTKNLYLINTDKLTSALKNELHQRSRFNPTITDTINIKKSNLTNDLIIRLLNYWGQTPKRVFPRNKKNENINITLGLSSAHKIIFDNTIGKKNSDILYNQFNHAAEFKSSNINSQKIEHEDIWNKIYPTSQIDNNFIDFETTINSEKPENITLDSVQTEQWDIINESAGGYCIRCQQNSESKAQVGELIGIRRSNGTRSSKWAVGVVCWMKSNVADEFELGIQMITPDAIAVGIKNCSSLETQTNYHRTLMLPQIKILNQAATLITVSGTFRVGNKIEIINLGKKIQVELSKQISNTGLFTQFEFYIKNIKNLPESDQEHSNDSSLNNIDLKSLWFSN